jgi:hypothetical protein
MFSLFMEGYFTIPKIGGGPMKKIFSFFMLCIISLCSGNNSCNEQFFNGYSLYLIKWQIIGGIIGGIIGLVIGGVLVSFIDFCDIYDNVVQFIRRKWNIK